MFELNNSQGKHVHGLWYKDELLQAPKTVKSNYPLYETVDQRRSKAGKPQVKLKGKVKPNKSQYVNIDDLLKRK